MALCFWVKLFPGDGADDTAFISVPTQRVNATPIVTVIPLRIDRTNSGNWLRKAKPGGLLTLPSSARGASCF